MFRPEQVAAALAAAPKTGRSNNVDWSKAELTTGGGVAATVASLRKARGKNKNPTKQQVAIRLDPDVLAAFRADGPGWQSRMNAVLRDWLVVRTNKQG